MSSTRPNVIVAFSDQHRGTDLGPAGNADVHTPTMNRLAVEGSYLSGAYSTHPLCGPSRACLISGQYPSTHGVVTNELSLPTDAPSIGEAFQDAGYRVGYVGKWHLDGVPRDRWTPPGPRRQGFDDFWAVHNCVHDYFHPQYYRDSPELIREEGYEPAVQTDLAIDFIDADDDRPFCLFLSWGPPHDPYRLVPDRYREQYDAASLDLRPNTGPIFPGHPANPTTGNTDAPPIREWGERVSPNTYEAGQPYGYEDPRECYADYYASITAIDDQLGRLVDALDDRAFSEDTILVYTSDHGDMLYSHGNNQKGCPHEEAIRVPLLVRWPDDIPAGTTNETLVGTCDLAPTLLGLADLTVPETMEGSDLSASLRDPTQSGSDSVFLYGENWRGVRTERYMYACVPPEHPDLSHLPGGHALLFDDADDPYQRTNRIYDPAYHEVRTELRARLDEWLKRTDDPHLPLAEQVRQLGRGDDWDRRQRYIAGDLAE